MAKFEWKDGVDGGTPLSADNLNAMQDGIYEDINSYTKTVDANGWTVLDFGTYKEYLKYTTFTSNLTGNSWINNVADIQLPTGISTIGSRICIGTAHASDPAIILGLENRPEATSIKIAGRNIYSSQISFTGHVSIRILEFE